MLTVTLERLIGCLSLIVPVGSGCGGWVGGDTGRFYYAAERGRAIRLVEVSIQETSTPFNPVFYVLVEPCDGSKQTGPEGRRLPCWPKERHRQTQALLRTLATTSPDYRYKLAVQHAAKYLNRHLGAWQRTWIIGTEPLALAFSRDAAELAKEIEASRTGGILDVGPRDAQFVTDQDMDQLSNVVLLFSEDLVLAIDGSAGTEQINPGQQVTILYFDHARPVGWLMRGSLNRTALRREAARSFEIPVRLQP